MEAGDCAMLKNRRDAGKLLAEKLDAFVGMENTLVLALPRGGVVVGAEIAERLKASFDVLIVRKIGHPWQGGESRDWSKNPSSSSMTVLLPVLL